MKLRQFLMTESGTQIAWEETSGTRSLRDESPGFPELHNAMAALLPVAISSIGIVGTDDFQAGCEVVGIKVKYIKDLPQLRFVLRRHAKTSNECSIIHTPFRPIYEQLNHSDIKYCYEAEDIALINDAINQIERYKDGVGRQSELCV